MGRKRNYKSNPVVEEEESAGEGKERMRIFSKYKTDLQNVKAGEEFSQSSQPWRWWEGVFMHFWDTALEFSKRTNSTLYLLSLVLYRLCNTNYHCFYLTFYWLIWICAYVGNILMVKLFISLIFYYIIMVATSFMPTQSLVKN